MRVPASPCRPRDRQRGNSLVLAMVVLTALATLSSLAVVSVRGGIATAGNDRFHTIAVYAAESGAAAAMDFLRKNVNQATYWTAYVSANNGTVQQPSLPGNNAQPAATGNLFSSDTRAWYSVQILNNQSDTGYATGADNDGRVIIRSTGYGPNGAVAQIDWEVFASSVSGLGRPCPAYAQKGMSEDGAGRNDCLGTIDITQSSTFNPSL